MAEGDTWKNALIGAAVAVVLAFLPFSPALGGGVAGYLQRGDLGDGAVVGGLAGVLSTLPLAVFAAVVGGIFLAVPFGMGEMGAMGGVLLAALLFVGLYTVGLSVLGGAAGAYIATETEIGPDDPGAW